METETEKCPVFYLCYSQGDKKWFKPMFDFDDDKPTTKVNEVTQQAKTITVPEPTEVCLPSQFKV